MNNSSNKVYVSDNFINFHSAFELLFVDTDVNIGDNGVLTIEGYKNEYSISFKKNKH